MSATDPFTVTYKIARAAAWSDGTPITADDFTYLTGQMQTQDGTIDPAGYRMITSVQSRDAGKTAVVVFRAPFQDWRELFSALLPSHTLKDAPGGWTDALDFILPVSGNRYKFTDLDTTTNEATLLRNDKFWGTQPGPASVVFRFGDGPALLDAFKRGDLQALLLRPDSATRAALDAAVPAQRRIVVPRPATIQLLFGVTSGPTAELKVRQAVAVGLDMPAVRTALGGTAGAVVAPSSAFALPATEPVSTVPSGATATTPATSVPESTAAGSVPGTAGNAATARTLLQSAGYRAGGVYFERDGTPLRLRLAYPAANARFAAAAVLIQAELGRVGIEIDLVSEPQGTVVADRFATTASADLALLAVPRGSSDAIAAASAFGCAEPPASPSTALAATATPPTPVLASSSSPASPSGETPTSTSAGGGPAVNQGAGNVSRFCDQSVQPALTRWLVDGRVDESLATLSDRPVAADQPGSAHGDLRRVRATGGRAEERLSGLGLGHAIGRPAELAVVIARTHPSGARRTRRPGRRAGRFPTVRPAKYAPANFREMRKRRRLGSPGSPRPEMAENADAPRRPGWRPANLPEDGPARTQVPAIGGRGRRNYSSGSRCPERPNSVRRSVWQTGELFRVRSPIRFSPANQRSTFGHDRSCDLAHQVRRFLESGGQEHPRS